jgi:hypothetical protein
MQKIIEVRFGSDSLLKDGEQLSYIRYFDIVLSTIKGDIISNKGHVNVISKKGTPGIIAFVNDNNDLNKSVNLKLFNSPPFQF